MDIDGRLVLRYMRLVGHLRSDRRSVRESQGRADGILQGVHEGRSEAERREIHAFFTRAAEKGTAVA
jgi:hypothetical protein